MDTNERLQNSYQQALTNVYNSYNSNEQYTKVHLDLQIQYKLDLYPVCFYPMPAKVLDRGFTLLEKAPSKKGGPFKSLSRPCMFAHLFVALH